MEARISSTRVRTTKGLIIYSFFFFISFYYLSGGSRREAHGARPSSPSPIFLDQTEARRAEKIIFRRPGPPTYLGVWMTAPPPPPSRPLISRSGSGTVDLNGIRGGAGGGRRGEENKNRLYINDFALSLVLKLRLGAAWKWSFVLRVIGDILSPQTSKTSESKASLRGRI